MSNAPPPPELSPGELSALLGGDKSYKKPKSLSGDTEVIGAGELFDAITGQTQWVPIGGDRSAEVPIRPKFSVNAASSYFEQASPEVQAKIQDLLYRAGFYGAGYTPLYGHVRLEDITAFQAAMVSAVSGGRNIRDYLFGAADTADKLGLRNPHSRANVSVVTSAVALQATLDGAFQDALGRNATPEERGRFVASIQSRQMAIDQANFDAQTAADQGTSLAQQGWTRDPATGELHQTGIPAPAPGPAGTRVMGSVEPETEAKVLARTEHPIEYGATQLGRNGQAILDAMNAQRAVLRTGG